MHTTSPTPEPNPRAELAFPADTELLARYAVLGEVGRGGMGIVYRARHKSLDRPVAIKITLPGATTERFLREARLLAKVNSPHVVAVHDFDVLPNGCPVLVMEWVEGTNLSQRIRAAGEPLAEAQVEPWMRHTCAGMLAAEEQGIIHRDLKPSNLLIDGHGCARVADFGLARIANSPGEQSVAGLLMGTPFYMAPEQAEDPGASIPGPTSTVSAPPSTTPSPVSRRSTGRPRSRSFTSTRPNRWSHPGPGVRPSPRGPAI